MACQKPPSPEAILFEAPPPPPTAARIPTPEPDNWHRMKEYDPISGGVYYATGVASLNTVTSSLTGRYTDESQAFLMLKTHPRRGNGVELSLIDDGYFDFPSGEIGTLLVRFDNYPPVRVVFIGEVGVLFTRTLCSMQYEWFYNSIKRCNYLYIEVPMMGTGPQVLQFNVQGL